jgi:hypothetical protein
MIRRVMLLAGLALALTAGRASSDDTGPPPNEVRDLNEVFIDRVMVVKGKGAAPTDRSLSDADKRASAMRAAKVAALRELAEVLSGMRISGETRIRDAAAGSDQVKAAVDGLVGGAQVVYESYDEHTKTGTVYVALTLDGPNGLTQNLLPTLIAHKAVGASAAPAYASVVASATATAATAPAAAPAAPEAADALIIDASGKQFRPALINRIVVDNGSVLFEPTSIPVGILARRGCGNYASDVGKAKAVLASHGAKNPMVVKAAGVVRSTDARISARDAAAVYSADKKTSLLQGVRVVFIL